MTSKRAKPDELRVWAAVMGVVYPTNTRQLRALRMAHQDALHARGLPTCMNPSLIKKGA